MLSCKEVISKVNWCRKAKPDTSQPHPKENNHSITIQTKGFSLKHSVFKNILTGPKSPFVYQHVTMLSSSYKIKIN